MTDMTQKKCLFMLSWTSPAVAALEMLLTALTQESVLRIPDPSQPFILQILASGTGLRGSSVPGGEKAPCVLIPGLSW